ncbi:hypothetical protein [Candidatus Amarobacter glycogenicus]|uniref:hypothetical protein n=1 Tax=Candidatus Amarobacter glycogenicus TaxID=3140699 RepID=UPI00313690CF|nr:hypothetical protein [Dehalococcoidia bacterium]
MPEPSARKSAAGKAAISFIRTPNLITRKPATPQAASTAGTNQAHHGKPSRMSATVVAAKTNAGSRCPYVQIQW